MPFEQSQDGRQVVKPVREAGGPNPVRRVRRRKRKPRQQQRRGGVGSRPASNCCHADRRAWRGLSPPPLPHEMECVAADVVLPIDAGKRVVVEVLEYDLIYKSDAGYMVYDHLRRG